MLQVLGYFACMAVAQDTLWLDRTWHFSTNDVPTQALPDISTRSWQAVDTDHRLDARYSAPAGAFVWYRIKVFLERKMQKRAENAHGMVLALGPIDAADQLYVNGEMVGSIGQFPPHYLPRPGVNRTYLIPYDKLLWDYDNHIALRVYVPPGGAGMHRGPGYLRIATLADWLQTSIALNSPNHLYPYPADTVTAMLTMCNVPEALSTRLIATITDSAGKHLYNSQAALHLNPHEEEQIYSVSWQPPAETVGFFTLRFSMLNSGGQQVWADSVAFGITSPLGELPSDPYHTIFWSRSVRELDAVPVRHARLVPVPLLSGQLARVYQLALPTIGGDTLCGWLSLPTDSTRKYPAWLMLSAYGDTPQPEYGGSQRIVLSLATRTPGACGYHDPDYWQRSLHQPQDYALRRAYLDAVQGMRYLRSLPQAGKTVAVGTGLGGNAAIAAASLDRGADACIAYEPWELILGEPPFSTWQAEVPGTLTPPEVEQTLRFFSPGTLAAGMGCPLLVALDGQATHCPLQLQYRSAQYHKGRTDVLVYTQPQGPNVLKPQVEQWLRSVLK